MPHLITMIARITLILSLLIMPVALLNAEKQAEVHTLLTEAARDCCVKRAETSRSSLGKRGSCCHVAETQRSSCRCGMMPVRHKHRSAPPAELPRTGKTVSLFFKRADEGTRDADFIPDAPRRFFSQSRMPESHALRQAIIGIWLT